MIVSQEQQFIDEGFVVVTLNISERQRSECLIAYERLIQKAEALGALGQVKTRKSDFATTAGSGWAWGCDHVYAPELREQMLLDIASSSPVPDLVYRILGARVRFSGGHAHWSPQSYDYYLHWHRDTRRDRWPYGNPDCRSHVQVCVAITDESVVHIVPRSHRRDIVDYEQDFFDKTPHGKHPDEVCPKVAAGQALFLNTFTLHRAQCDYTYLRRSLHFGFTRIGSAPEPGRRGHAQPWLAEPNFMMRQTRFMQNCIAEELHYQQHAVNLDP